MSSVGEILRGERVRQGKELGPIADALCITKRYLDAIEHNDLKTLPGVFFYRSFVKQYADILGVDEKILAGAIAALLPAEEPLPLPGDDPVYKVSPSPVKYRDPRGGDPIIIESNRRMLSDNRVAIPAVALVVALLGGGFVYERWTKTGRPAEVSNSAPAATQATAEKAPAAVPRVEAGREPVAFEQVGTFNGLDNVQINVAATEKVWISITSDGKQIFSGILEPSQSKSLSGREFAKVSVGNAAGLEIRWNGKAIGPIGKRGQVKTLRFTKDNFEILPPANQVGQTL